MIKSSLLKFFPFILISYATIPISEANENPYVEITVNQNSDASWIVDLVIPNDNLGLLELREMRYTHENCEPIEYSLIEYSGAEYNSEHSTESRMYFSPINQEALRISYLVTAQEYRGSHSIDSMSGCSSLMDFGEYSLLDGKALLLALRPLNMEGVPYRFGDTRFTYSSEFEEPSYLSDGSYEGNNSWIFNRADDLWFSFLAAGNWESKIIEIQDGPTLSLVYADQVSNEASELSTLITDTFESLEDRWGNAEVDTYSVLISPPILDAGSFGQYTGLANPNSSAIHQGVGLNKRHLMTLIVHEIAHHWMPRLLGMVDQDTWIGEGLVELVTYIELVKMGYVEEDFLVSRINRSISNLQSNYEVSQLDYDFGIISWIAATQFTNTDPTGDRFDNLIEALEEESEQTLTSDRFWGHSELPTIEFNSEDNSILISHLPCQFSINGSEYELIEHAWPTYERGFVLSNTVPGLIERIIPGSAAERTGLNSDDTIFLIDSFGYGDIHNSVIIHYSRDQHTNSVAYLPIGDPGPVVYPQYVSSLMADLYQESQRCTNL